jgi:uncharacterized integral membrane protein
MKGLKIIPLFVGLILLSYLGVSFVEANRTEVVIAFGNYQWPPTAVGFVVLTSALCGMILSGALCSIEILALFLRLSRLRRRLSLFEEGKLRPTSPAKPADLSDSAKAELSHREIG